MLWTKLNPSYFFKGVDRDDSATKSTTGLAMDNKIPYTDIKVMVNEYFREKWQQLWKRIQQSKLFQIKAILVMIGTRTS